MPRIKFVTDVSQWGLLTWPARSRLRLITCTVLATAVAVAVALGSAHYILEASASVLLNLMLITTNMMVMLVAAFLQTVLVGDLFFSQDWRERIFLGNKQRDVDAIDIAAVNDHNGEFAAILFLAIVVNAFCLNLVTGNFFSQYHDEGFFQVQMRSSSVDQRLAALESIADPVNNRLWERDGLRQLVVDGFEDPASEVRHKALWAAGALEILRSREPLMAVVGAHEDPATREEAAFALGKLGPHRESRELLESLLVEENPRPVRLGALRGLAMMGDHRSVEAVLAHIDDDDEEVMAYAFWTLARIGSDAAADDVRSILEDESLEHGVRRCAALEAFKLVAVEEDAEWARHQFRRTDPDDRCEALTFEELNEAIHHVIWGESVRIKWLKTVGNTDPFSHHRWIKRLISDPDEEVHLRDVAAEINRQMNR